MTWEQVGILGLMLGAVCTGVSYFGIVAHPALRLGFSVALVIFAGDIGMAELNTINLAGGAAFVGVFYWLLEVLTEEFADFKSKDFTVSKSLGAIWPARGAVTSLPTDIEDPMSDLFDIQEVTA
jgi:hypothetical protein